MKLKPWNEIHNTYHVMHDAYIEQLFIWAVGGPLIGRKLDESQSQWCSQRLVHGFDWASTGNRDLWASINQKLNDDDVRFQANGRNLLKEEFLKFFAFEDIDYELKFEENDEDCI